MTVNGRILSSNSPVLLWLVTIAVMIVGLVSFTLSFTALTQLAAMARIPAEVAWGWPLMVDGTIVVATFGTLVLRTRDRVAARTYPWMVLMIFGAISIYANGVHATGGHIGTSQAFVVGAVAPFALLTSTHLLVLMLTSPEKEASDSDLRREAKKKTATTAPAAPVPPVRSATSTPSTTTTAPPAAVVPSPVHPRPAPSPSAVPDDAVERRILEYRSENGRWPSGGTVGQWLGKSAKTGVRLVNRLRDVHEQAASTPGA